MNGSDKDECPFSKGKYPQGLEWNRDSRGPEEEGEMRDPQCNRNASKYYNRVLERNGCNSGDLASLFTAAPTTFSTSEGGTRVYVAMFCD